jgi:hypothetical protein
MPTNRTALALLRGAHRKDLASLADAVVCLAVIAHGMDCEACILKGLAVI